MQQYRFTLRREYFGGVLHDAHEIFCDVLSPMEYDFLRSLKAIPTVPARPANPDGTIVSSAKLASWTARGAVSPGKDQALQLVNTRIVELPVIPAKCLTAPLRVYDTYTRRCNLNCPQCCLAGGPTFVERRRTLAQTKLIMNKFWEAGAMEWRFTGGEPTSCPDLLGAIAHAKNLGMAVMLNTNGCWSEQMMQEIPVSGVDELIISLEGREEINDQRRNHGTFQRVMQAFERVHQVNRSETSREIRVTINMTVARDNIGELEFVARLAARNHFNLNFVPLRPYGRAPTELPQSILSTAEFMKFSEHVQQLREDPEIAASGIRIIHRNMDLFCPDYPDSSTEPFPFNYSECGALTTGFALCPDGHVNACSFLMDDPEFVGPSLLDVSVQEAWLDPSMEHFRRAEKLGCVGCRFYMRQCEGKCRAMVFASGGKILKEKLIGHDPYCFAAAMPH